MLLYSFINLITSQHSTIVDYLFCSRKWRHTYRWSTRPMSVISG